MEQVTITVTFTRDEQAGVWVATSEDVLGLAIEDESLDALTRRLHDVIPELIELNGLPQHHLNTTPNVPVSLLVQHQERLDVC